MSAPAPMSPELAHYLSVLWRRRRIALAAAVITMIVCLLTVAIRGRTITVSSSILSESAVTDTKRQRLFTEKLLEENSTRRREIEESLIGFTRQPSDSPS